MKTNALASGAIAVILAAASVPAAIAQPYNDGSYARSAGDYEYQRDVYAREQADYAERQAQYQRDYNAYMRAQRDYDRRYGRGAYVRRYGVFQGAAVSPNQASYDCGRRRDGNTTAGVIIGAIAGGVIGSNVAGRGVRNEGAVLGAIVGGAAGGAIARGGTTRCDNAGVYYSYNDTVAYREGSWERGRRSGRYDNAYYMRRNCRLAVAEVDYGGRVDRRYVRVCPDRYGRYRVTN
ncbi:MAG: hypothetical protein U1E50_13065 [Caulobacteraceae bacterium]